MAIEEKVSFRTENVDEFVYYYNNAESITSQCIACSNNNYLVNVRKIYTDNVYYGVGFTLFNKVQGLMHHFKCKDRLMGVESNVDNSSVFIELFENYSIDINEELDLGSIYEKQSFKILPNVHFCYNSVGKYKYTTIEIDSDIYRGFYYPASPPSESELLDYLAEQKTKNSNNNITISTNYSNIIVEHHSQYNKEWSDIKRRKNYA